MATNEDMKTTTVHNPLQPVMEFLQGGDPDSICSKYSISRAELDQRLGEYQKSLRQAALTDQLIFRKVNRNEPCPCGSGKKYKKCCLAKHEEARKHIPKDRLEEMEERAKNQEKLEKEVEKGFDLIFTQEFDKAQRLAERLLKVYPEDDRLYDILVSTLIAKGKYDDAFVKCRERWQVALEERTFYQENGRHKREGEDQKNLVYFYSPSTWLERFWIMQRARAYRQAFPRGDNPYLLALADKLKAANDMHRFPGKQEEGYAMRKEALAPALRELANAGPKAIPYLLPLTYQFSWASLFVPDLLNEYGTDDCVRLLAELSMFRFPFFAQKCLSHLETMGERIVPFLDEVLKENSAFDEMKVGIIMVLGAIRTPESFAILTRLTEHENPYVVNWAAQALGQSQNPEALPYLEKAKERLGALSKIAGAIQDIVRHQNQ
jgi:fructose-specific component phosphotransferase system IIB-like protein